MSRAEVKICGLKTPETIAAAVKGGALYLGFNFEPSSPRVLSLSGAADLRGLVPPAVRLVALTADAGDDRLDEIVAAARPDMVQLHGEESPARVAAIRARFGLPVIKSIAVARMDDQKEAHRFEPVADMLLFDTKIAGRTGGTGTAFDWRLLSGKSFARPWFLAGGLKAENVKEAAAQSGAHRFDVSSGVERARGEKDEGLIRAFLDSVRAL